MSRQHSGRAIADRKHHGVAVIESIFTLILIASAAGMIGWALLVQLDTNRRIARAAEGASALQSLMHQIRADLLSASSVEVDGPKPLPHEFDADRKREAMAASDTQGRNARWRGDGDRLLIHTSAGDIRYQVEFDGPLDLRGEGPADPPGPLEQTIIRIDPASAEHRWLMRGRVIRFAPGPGAHGQILIVREEVPFGFITGNLRTRRLETSLLAGARP